MSRSLRRYEVLLPLRFNDGQPVPDELVADTLLDLNRENRIIGCAIVVFQPSRLKSAATRPKN
jgi:hypothetical protein